MRTEDLSSTRTIWVSVVQFVLGIVIYVMSYLIFDEAAGSWNSSTFGSSKIARIELSFVMMPIGLIFWQQPLFRICSYTPLRVIGVALILAAFILACAVISAIIFVDWGIKKWLAWNLNFDKPVRMVQGMYLVLTLWLTGFTLLCIMIRLLYHREAVENASEMNDTDSYPLLESAEIAQGAGPKKAAQRSERSLYDKLSEAVGIISFFWVLIPLLMWTNCVLTSDWHRLDPNMVDLKLATWSRTDDWTTYYSFTCEYENSQDTDSDITCYARLYYDIQIYFEFIFVVSMFSYIVTKFPRARLFVRRRVSFPCFSSCRSLNYFPNSMTIGEIFFWFLWLAMMVSIGYYFVAVHKYDDTSDKSTKEVWARYTGILSMQFLCFGIFSVTRVRLWRDCFQVSFEHLISYHRFFGYCMIITGYIHAIIWMSWFSTNNSGYSLSDNAPFGDLPFTYHDSNFSIPMMYQYMIILVPIFYGICSFYMIRRKYFELFYYTHLVMAVITITLTLWHATQSWRYLIAPLALYAVDRAIRMYNSSLLCQCVELTTNFDDQDLPYGCQATKLTFRVAKCGDSEKEARFGKLNYKMGQYCFVNICDISSYEWHPYTISSGEHARESTFHIKAMTENGDGSWSSLLHDLANAGVSPHTVDIHIDGPYGKEFTYEEYDRVVLVAGGIGITPCHSIFDTLLDIATTGETVPFVDLIWVMRHQSQASMFVDTLKKYEGSLDLNRFSVRLFATRIQETEEEIQNIIPGTNVTFSQGRPEWGTLLRSIINADQTVSPGKSLVFACGPAAMVNDVEEVSVFSGAQFYSESFEF